MSQGLKFFFGHCCCNPHLRFSQKNFVQSVALAIICSAPVSIRLGLRSTSDISISSVVRDLGVGEFFVLFLCLGTSIKYRWIYSFFIFWYYLEKSFSLIFQTFVQKFLNTYGMQHKINISFPWDKVFLGKYLYGNGYHILKVSRLPFCSTRKIK